MKGERENESIVKPETGRAVVKVPHSPEQTLALPLHIPSYLSSRPLNSSPSASRTMAGTEAKFPIDLSKLKK